jgi:phosphoribosylanthranilate isomerase
VTAVKICGLTRPEDVALACELGAAWVGFNFAAESPRRVDPASSRWLAEATAPGVARVGVFVDESPSLITEAVEAARLDLLQIHRSVGLAEAEAAPRPLVAVVRVGTERPEAPAPALRALCRALLLDSRRDGAPGGTGETFEWDLVAGRDFGIPVLLAGGLSPENVEEAVRRVRPWGVDVASGVESAPGKKDAARMRRFFEAVRRADGGGA